MYNILYQISGMKEGDYLVDIGERDVKWDTHDTVVRLIREAEDCLRMRLVTPQDRTHRAQARVSRAQSYLRPDKVSPAVSDSSGVSSSNSETGIDSTVQYSIIQYSNSETGIYSTVQ